MSQPTAPLSQYPPSSAKTTTSSVMREPPKTPPAVFDTKRTILLVTNAAMTVLWFRVLLVFFTNSSLWWSKHNNGDTNNGNDDTSMSCDNVLRPRTIHALLFSVLELVNSTTGLTRSKPHQVLLFVIVRTGVEFIVAPLLPSCASWQHLWTVLCWSFGDVIRFGCFAIDAILSSDYKTQHHNNNTNNNAVKTVRYTVGPIVFPLGALGEMLMVLKAASDGRPLLYGVAALWPIGFYPLMRRLLKQRRKHLNTIGSAKSGGRPAVKKSV